MTDADASKWALVWPVAILFLWVLLGISVWVLL